MSSTRKGGERSRKPKHQNKYAFKHNKNSKKTKKIKALPNVTLGLCPRCSEQIMWKIKYRKYKPVKQPGKCRKCMKKNVLVAYHTLCRGCAKKAAKCAKCHSEKVGWKTKDGSVVASAKAPVRSEATTAGTSDPSSKDGRDMEDTDGMDVSSAAGAGPDCE